MAVERLTFDPEGDLVLRLTYPSDAEQTKIAGIAKPPEQVDMLVSSKHLRLASPVFKAMLQGSFREGQALQSTGKAEVPLPDDDPAAFKILLDIVHGFPSKVPRSVDLSTLANLSILVDKYRMLEVVSVYVKSFWVPNLRSASPPSSGNMFPWLSIAWVFQLSAEFTEITRMLAQEDSCGPIPHLDQRFPIPDKVIAKIDHQRTQAIAPIFRVIDDIIRVLSSPDPYPPLITQHPFSQQLSANICNGSSHWRHPIKNLNSRSTCDALMLGTVLRDATKLGLHPTPAPPYNGLTVKDVVEKAKGLDIVSLCDIRQDQTFYGGPSDYAHGQMKRIATAIKAAEAAVTGLSLSLIDHPLDLPTSGPT
ncbi:hypothetical protein MBM_07962 [Drepanopeziza brunnea f. sp. 'multigermtubi' MB_m1]|uniref:BTB domain-containing protein n=1 Tax=Marssonina brunnea f. sp. multigermtubi (strain MB_m1) TaxID=1072389 RepID=K1WLM4_MARBU|nr:uncharacterized protein MBM_07962 [Drepanopeziza brunnea f. sp. 'multigermtubi' MB_m1]EKD13761.1 hypothetical protein MBM_07962 [Drepanopeziza brunnea f. sp. 'multigermtubi' MB_m1]